MPQPDSPTSAKVSPNTFINSDKVYNILLSEKKYKPECLYVDPVSLEPTWCEPLRTAVREDSEDPTFPPMGWQNLTQGESPGWERTDDGSEGWTIPAWDSFYAMANDDAAGSESDGCCDYLITPVMDLRESDGYMMSFNSFYDGLYGQLAFVEYSTDGGATWEVLYQMMPATEWKDMELDLAAFSGLPFVPAANKFAVMGAHDDLVLTSGVLKTLAVSL